MLQRLGTPLISASHLRLVNDKLNLRFIRPLLFLHDLHNVQLMLLFCKVWKNCHHLIYGAFGAPAFWNKYCHIRLWYHNSYFKILWGLQFFFVVCFKILSTPLKGGDMNDICKTFLSLAFLLTDTMIKVRIFKVYARFSRRSLVVTDPPVTHQVTDPQPGKSIFRRKQSWSLKATPNCLMLTDPSRKPFTKMPSIFLPSSCVGLWLIFWNPSSCRVERKSGFSLLKSQLMSPQIIVGLSESTKVGILSLNVLLWALL